MGKRAQQRKQATINLVHGQDDDLIRWLSNLPKGAANNALKQVLRCGLELPQPQQKIDELTELKNKVKQFEGMVSNIPRMMKQQPPMDDDRIQRLEQDIEEIAKWAEQINQRIEQLYHGGNGVSEQPIIEPAPELSVEDQHQRANKLKKAKW